MTTNKTNENKEGSDRITKMEEQYAYIYLLKTIIPKALHDTYYSFIQKYPDRYPERKYARITERDIIKNLKKIRVGRDRIEYLSIINDRLEFEFAVVKELHLDDTKDNKEIWNKYFIIGVKGPMGDDWKWYEVDSRVNLTENKDEEDQPVSLISKNEEQKGIQFILKKALPKTVKELNDYDCNKRNPYNVSDLGKTLQKHKVVIIDGLTRIWFKVGGNNNYYYFALVKSNINSKLKCYDKFREVYYTV